MNSTQDFRLLEQFMACHSVFMAFRSHNFLTDFSRWGTLFEPRPNFSIGHTRLSLTIFGMFMLAVDKPEEAEETQRSLTLVAKTIENWTQDQEKIALCVQKSVDYFKAEKSFFQWGCFTLM